MIDNRCPSVEEYRARVRQAGEHTILWLQDLQHNPFVRPHEYIQLLNPKTNRYVKIDRYRGVFVSEKRSAGPYKGVRIVTPTDRMESAIEPDECSAEVWKRFSEPNSAPHWLQSRRHG